MLEQGLKRNGEELQRDSISRAAHKAIPLLSMLKPGQCGCLQAITPEHIKDTSAENSTALAMRLEKELIRYDVIKTEQINYQNGFAE